jgi:hypothetical protein
MPAACAVTDLKPEKPSGTRIGASDVAWTPGARQASA